MSLLNVPVVATQHNSLAFSSANNRPGENGLESTGLKPKHNEYKGGQEPNAQKVADECVAAEYVLSGS